MADVATEMYSGVQRIPSSVFVISDPDMFRMATTAQAPLRRTALNVMARADIIDAQRDDQTFAEEEGPRTLLML